MVKMAVLSQMFSELKIHQNALATLDPTAGAYDASPSP